MTRFSLWLQRCYILGFLLFAWYIAPFTRFAPLFPIVWSLVVAGSALVIPVRTSAHAEQPVESRAAQGVVVGLLVGLAVGSADWSTLDFILLFEFCWALMPLFLFDRFFGWAWSKLRPHVTSPSYR